MKKPEGSERAVLEKRHFLGQEMPFLAERGNRLSDTPIIDVVAKQLVFV